MISQASLLILAAEMARKHGYPLDPPPVWVVILLAAVMLGVVVCLLRDGDQ